MPRAILSPISNFWYVLLNLLYPQNCLICNLKLKAIRPGSICEDCSNKIRINEIASCLVNEADKFAFDAVLHAANYDDVIKRCIHLFKYENKVQMKDLLGKLMSDFAGRNIDPDEIDFVVPVPLHPVKLRERQFNQSEVLAAYLAKKLNKKMVKDRLKRIKYTMPQTELKREQRLKNVNGAFRAKRNTNFEDKTVLLVDDVLTTGATLNECAKALKDAGAKKVIAFALARGN